MDDQGTSGQVQAKYPFRITRIFFSNIHLFRADEPPEGELQVVLIAELAMIKRTEDQNIIGVKMLVHTPDDTDSKLGIEIEVNGLVDYLGEGNPDSHQLEQFINEQLLIAVISSVNQLIGTTTAQMGMPPIWPSVPRAFGFDLSKYLNQNELTE